jgi:hypothetical protein
LIVSNSTGLVLLGGDIVDALMIAVVFLGALILILALLLPSLFVRLPTSEELREVQEAKERISLQTDRLSLRNDVRTTLLQVITGLVLILGAYFTWNQVQDNQKALSANLRNSEEQLRLAQEAQATQSFGKAIDQLGSKQLEVRMGGLYALGRFAEKSDKDKHEIAQILSAYIRIHSPWPPPKDSAYAKSRIDTVPRMRLRAPDVQIALTRLGTLTDNGRSYGFVLRSVDLRMADLRDLHLEGSDLRESYVGGADLRDVHLEESDLRGADFSHSGTNLDGAKFTKAWHNKDTRWPKDKNMSSYELRFCDLDSKISASYCDTSG